MRLIIMLATSMAAAMACVCGAKADDLGVLYGGATSGPVQLHRPDGSWVGVAGLPNYPPPLSSSPVKVAVIDSGVLSGHPQLRGLISKTRDFSGEGIADRTGHGTIDAILVTAGQLAVDPSLKEIKSALLIAKVTRMVGGKAQPSRTLVISAIKWAVSEGAKIINLSLGFEDEEEDNAELCSLIKRSTSALFVSAAGNNGPQVRAFPASCDVPNVVSVGAAASWSGLGDVNGPGTIPLGLFQQ